MKPRPSFTELLAFNVAVLEQALPLVAFFDGREAAFGVTVGPHLRHIVEHYDALLDSTPGSLVDYDHRARDVEVQTVPATCRQRLLHCISRLNRLSDRSAGDTIAVGFSVGLEGAEFCVSHSTLARELQFLGSHAIHHYAVLKPLLAESGMKLPQDFGKAPDTVRHERQQRGA